MRFLASVAVIEETGKDVFSATNVTKNLVVEGSQAGVCHGYARKILQILFPGRRLIKY
jgi:hypothetical protein